MKHDLKTLASLLKEVISVDTYDNGEFIETEVNYSEIAEYLIDHRVIVQQRSNWTPTDLDDQYEGLYKCSNCQHEVFAPTGEPYEEYQHCPMCGAKMEEKQ